MQYPISMVLVVNPQVRKASLLHSKSSRQGSSVAAGHQARYYALVLTCYTLAGQEVLLLKSQGSELASHLHQRIGRQLRLQNLRLLLDGELLSNMWEANPAITVGDLSQIHVSSIEAS